MKKRPFTIGVASFLVLSSLFLISLSFMSEIQRTDSTSHFVEITFRSDEPDWFYFYLTVQYLGKIAKYNSTEIFTNVEDCSGVGVILDDEFQSSIPCHLFCQMINYNVTIQRDLMSDKKEMLYDEEGRSIEWTYFKNHSGDGQSIPVIGLSNVIVFFIGVIFPLTVFVSWAIWPRLENGLKQSSLEMENGGVFWLKGMNIHVSR